MVAGISGVDNGDGQGRMRRTYKIQPGPPVGTSYARDIAARYGISFEQIVATLQDRQVLDDSES
jgi:hypothetical protein